MSDYEIDGKVLDEVTHAAYQTLLEDGWVLPHGASVRDHPEPADLKAADQAAEQENLKAIRRITIAAAPLIAAAAHRAGREQVLEAVRQLIAPESAMGATPFGGGERWFAELDIYEQVLARDYGAGVHDG